MTPCDILFDSVRFWVYVNIFLCAPLSWPLAHTDNLTRESSVFCGEGKKKDYLFFFILFYSNMDKRQAELHRLYKEHEYMIDNVRRTLKKEIATLVEEYDLTSEEANHLNEFIQDKGTFFS